MLDSAVPIVIYKYILTPYKTGVIAIAIPFIVQET